MKLVIDNKEYPIKPISIADYEYFTDNQGEIDDLDLVHRFTDCSIEELKKAKYSDIKFIAKMIMGRFGSDEDKGKLDLVFELDGIRYGLIKPSELSYEEWVNLEVFMAQDPIDLSLISTHLYKPLKSDKIGDERELIPYDLNECQSRIELFREKVPMSRVVAAFFFIATFVQKLTESFLASTEAKMKTEAKPQKKRPKILQQK
jgi:hypothetical protein